MNECPRCGKAGVRDVTHVCVTAGVPSQTPGTWTGVSTVGQRGAWECPRCRAINAWWVPRCDCKPPAAEGRYPKTARAAGDGQP